MPERRTKDRRTNPAVPEPLERKKERRQGDRRESARRSARVVVRDGRAQHSVEAEVSLGGASFDLSAALPAPTVTLELLVTSTTRLELPAVVTRSPQARTPGRRVQVTFGALDTTTELALARWLDHVDD